MALLSFENFNEINWQTYAAKNVRTLAQVLDRSDWRALTNSGIGSEELWVTKSAKKRFGSRVTKEYVKNQPNV
jgi:hypothetical protein